MACRRSPVRARLAPLDETPVFIGGLARCGGIRPRDRTSDQRQNVSHWRSNITLSLSYFNEVDKGGHFAAWEEPEVSAGEVRAVFRSLRWVTAPECPAA